MRIQSAQLDDFRNIASAKVELSPRLTALIGPNGQGKTNFLEALYCASALRPLRSVQRSDLIRAHESVERARVNLAVRSERTGLEHELTMELRTSSRSLFKDGKRC